MLVNLVENALQHNQRPIEVRLLLKADADGKGCLLTVADDGIGIPLGERTNVLRRFYRLDVSRSTQGSGLGLSLVAAIANYHGAALTLEDNEPGLKAFLHFA
jgi:signal transduction histidine kinase